MWYNYTYKETHIVDVLYIVDIVDIHENGTSTHLNVCIQNHIYSNICMYTKT